jgi:hypothetical protein
MRMTMTMLGMEGPLSKEITANVQGIHNRRDWGYPLQRLQSTRTTEEIVASEGEAIKWSGTAWLMP